MSEETGICEVCGEPMDAGEEIFRYHGASGPCPKPPRPVDRDIPLVERLRLGGPNAAEVSNVAANEIEKLRARLALFNEMREALENSSTALAAMIALQNGDGPSAVSDGERVAVKEAARSAFLDGKALLSKLSAMEGRDDPATRDA